MPEFSQIQTYVRCEELNYKNIISKYVEMLTKFGFNKAFLEEELSNLEWEVSDNGFVYIGCNVNPISFLLNGVELNLRPHVMGWTSVAFPKLKENWLELSLLFETEQIIQDLNIYTVAESLGNPIWEMIEVFSEYFNETGTYFTDEVTNGRPWESLIGEGNDFWSFDGAIIPISISKYYDNVPSEFKKLTINNKIYLVRKKAWNAIHYSE